jgi:hypothetical protein
MQAVTLTKDRPALSSERAPHKKKNPMTSSEKGTNCTGLAVRVGNDRRSHLIVHTSLFLRPPSVLQSLSYTLITKLSSTATSRSLTDHSLQLFLQKLFTNSTVIFVTGVI